MKTVVMRPLDWAYPTRPVRREVLSAQPDTDSDRPPMLFVPGYGHGAWAFAEHWLEHAAGRGYPAYAMSLRGHGQSGHAPRTTLRAYAHDVAQVAAALPRQAVLVGHGVGGLVVARALTRYPARAAVLAAPVLRGWASLGAALLNHPAGTLPAIFGGRLRLRRRQLFGRDLDQGRARDYAAKMRGRAPLVQWQLLAHRAPARPAGDPPVLVVGSPDDRIVPRGALVKVARAYGGEPLLFPGMGHDLMLDTRWSEPLDAILDWLDKLP